MITVHGLLGTPSPELREAAENADWVVGGLRHLDALDVDPQRRIVLGSLEPAVERIQAFAESVDVLVVASGDPAYFGILRALRAHSLHPRVVTAPSSIAAAFAAVGLPWDDAAVVSVHGRPLAGAVNLARALPKVAVFTSPADGLRELAAALTDVPRWYVLAERLGDPEERIRILDADEAVSTEPVEPNVVLILAAAPQSPDLPWEGSASGPGRPQRPQVSAAAAVAFARLLPEPGELLCSSGPLGYEVAALAAWAQAAVLMGRPGAITPPATPDVVVADAGEGTAWLTSGPRAVVLTGTSPAELPSAYRWTSERIGDHQLTTGARA